MDILELFTTNPNHSLGVEPLAEDLAPDYPDVSVAQVAYYRARLQDAEPLPSGR